MGACAGELVWTTGRVGGDELRDGDCDVWDCRGSGRVKLGLGEGMLTRTLLRFAVGLGLRLLIWEIGEANPLAPPRPSVSKGTGATMAMESMTSLSSMSEVRISAALSSTDGTDWSSCSVSLPRGIRCGSALCATREGGGVRGSMSRSKMAEDEEFLDVKKDENCTSERGYIEIKEENFLSEPKLI